MKKALYVIIAILLAVIIFFMGVLINQNTNNSLIKQTEEVAKQATETSSSNAYITTEDHLAELSDANKHHLNSFSHYESSSSANFSSTIVLDTSNSTQLKMKSVTKDSGVTLYYIRVSGITANGGVRLANYTSAFSTEVTIDVSAYNSVSIQMAGITTANAQSITINNIYY